MRPVLAISTAELRRFLRDRSNIFFVFIFPLLLVLVIGSQFGGSGPSGTVTVTGSGEASTRLTQELRDRELTVRHSTPDQARSAVARGRTDVALIVSDQSAADPSAPESVTDLQMLVASSGTSIATAQQVRTAVSAVGLEQTQHQALTSAGVDDATAERLLGEQRQGQSPTLRRESTDPLDEQFAGLGRFDLGATSQLLLFTFLSTLAGSATLIQARREKVIARALSTPAGTGRVLLGHAVGRWVIALAQGSYIMVATALLFGVQWGNWALSLLILGVFAAVAAGLAMVIGALVDNETAAAGVGVGVGLVLAGLGGGMAPLEIFSDTMRQVAHITPHAWAYEAYAQVQRHGGGLDSILGELGVLTVMALAALSVGVLTLRRSVARAM